MCKSNALFGFLAFVPLAGWSQTLPQYDGHVHQGVATCASSQCHGSAVPRTGQEILQSEYVTWTNADPHAGAYTTLTSEESAAIVRRLGIGSASEADECLDCHADNVPTALRGERFQITDGVGCEACHGGSEDWLVSHYNDSASDHAANIAAGLYPAEEGSRAILCLSCHLGTNNKLASHRLMAAGHPRLAFELDTFTELWRLAGNPPHYEVDADYALRKAALDHSRTWIRGLFATAARQLDLLSGPALTTGGAFPELGLFDCHACHRTMKEIDWRPLRRYGGIGPGRPLLDDSSFVILIAILRGLESSDATAVEEDLQALHQATTRDMAAIQQAARNMAQRLVMLQPRITNQDLSVTGKRRVLRELGSAAREGEFLDYAAAEQAFMGVQTLVFDLQDDTLQRLIEPLAVALQDDEAYDRASFMQMLSRLAQ